MLKRGNATKSTVVISLGKYVLYSIYIFKRITCLRNATTVRLLLIIDYRKERMRAYYMYNLLSTNSHKVCISRERKNCTDSDQYPIRIQVYLQCVLFVVTGVSSISFFFFYMLSYVLFFLYIYCMDTTIHEYTLINYLQSYHTLPFEKKKKKDISIVVCKVWQRKLSVLRNHVLKILT